MDDSAAERKTRIERIAENLARFDDDTLAELDRLTDPATDLVPEPGRAARGRLTRRELITGALAGGTLGALGGAGAVLALRPPKPFAADSTRLQALVNAHERLEAVGIDGVAKAGLTTVGASVIEAGTAVAGLRAGLDVIEGILSVPVQGLDTGFYSVLRKNVLVPAADAADAVEHLTETWRLEMATPLQARLEQRDTLRRQLGVLEQLGDSGA